MWGGAKRKKIFIKWPKKSKFSKLFFSKYKRLAQRKLCPNLIQANQFESGDWVGPYYRQNSPTEMNVLTLSVSLDILCSSTTVNNVAGMSKI